MWTSALAKKRRGASRRKSPTFASCPPAHAVVIGVKTKASPSPRGDRGGSADPLHIASHIAARDPGHGGAEPRRYDVPTEMQPAPPAAATGRFAALFVNNTAFT